MSQLYSDYVNDDRSEESPYGFFIFIFDGISYNSIRESDDSELYTKFKVDDYYYLITSYCFILFLIFNFF